MACCGSRLAWAVLVAGSVACGESSPPTAPSPSHLLAASIRIENLTASVQPLLTTPQPGLVYRLIYRVRESGGKVGATLVSLRFELSNGHVSEGAFDATRIPPGSSVPLVSSLSIYPASVPASHVTFTITYTDDNGQAGTASVANVSISVVE